MKNPTPTNQNGVLALLATMFAAATEHGASTGLHHVTAALLLATRSAAALARNALETGRQVLRDQRVTFDNAFEEARVFASVARELLKPVFGSQYNERWDVTGFVGELAMPRRLEDMLGLLESLKNFFAANPALELGPRITAVQAQALYDALSDARNAMDLQRTVIDNLMADRDVKFDAAEKVIRDLTRELETLLDPMDARWLAFGLNKPGAQETPDIVEGVTATLIGATAAALKWPAPARAEYYHVWRRVQGVDEEYVLIGSPADLDFTAEGLPTNAHVDFAISAVNNGGEGERSASVTVLTHA